MAKKGDVKEKSKKKVPVKEFWYDPMNYPAFLKQHDDKSLL